MHESVLKIYYHAHLALTEPSSDCLKFFYLKVYVSDRLIEYLKVQDRSQFIRTTL